MFQRVFSVILISFGAMYEIVPFCACLFDPLKWLKSKFHVTIPKLALSLGAMNWRSRGSCLSPRKV